ncbi:MAG TPA: hypothetical protein DCE41_06935 [Cytophagales bacterium]|nr:hypothetical protein [Cytophagales bacterium]HAA22051.1 hypothetical protein [Cytophagales bacterium]HAP58578.1 hypothetical protein [Cytophagales bacterium]
MNTTKILRLLNAFTLAITLFVNYWVNTDGNSGRSVGEISDAYPTLITPAGYAFSIWALIYSLLIGFVVIQWSAKRPEELITRISGWFILSNLANAGWIFTFLAEQFWLSVILMFVLLGSLVVLTLRLITLDFSRWANRVFIRNAIMIYLGWIVAASVVNVSAALVSNRWGGAFLSPEAWGILMISTATLVYLFLLKQIRAVASAGVGIWALVAITVARDSTAFGIEVAAWGAVIVLAGGIFTLLLLGRQKRT